MPWISKCLFVRHFFLLEQMLTLLIIGTPKSLFEPPIESEYYERKEYVRPIKKFLENSDTVEGDVD